MNLTINFMKEMHRNVSREEFNTFSFSVWSPAIKHIFPFFYVAGK